RRVVWLARSARAPARPSAVLPRSAAAPRGRDPLPGEKSSSGFLPHVALSPWSAATGGRGPRCLQRGRGQCRTRRSTWLASLAPPPGLRPYSPVPLPFHGGDIQGRGRLAARQPRGVTWLASLAPTPGLRRTPFRCRSNGGEVLLTGSRFGFLPHIAVSGVGEWPVRAEGARPSGRKGQTVVCWLASLAPPPGLRPYSPVPLPFHGGEIQRRGWQAARGFPLTTES